MFKKIIILSLMLTGCAKEIFDYEIKEAYTICPNSLYSVEILDYSTLIIHCSDGKKSSKRRDH